MSNSKKWINRKIELAQKENLLLEDLNFNSSKAKKIALWSLGSGVVALLGYGIYQTFFNSHPEKRKKKNEKKWVPKDSPFVDTAIENIGPSLGKWLLRQLKD